MFHIIVSIVLFFSVTIWSLIFFICLFYLSLPVCLFYDVDNILSYVTACLKWRGEIRDETARREKNEVRARAVENSWPHCAVPARREHGGCFCLLFSYFSIQYLRLLNTVLEIRWKIQALRATERGNYVMSVLCRYDVGMMSAWCRHDVGMLSVCCRYVVGMLSECCRNVVGMLLVGMYLSRYVFGTL